MNATGGSTEELWGNWIRWSNLGGLHRVHEDLRRQREQIDREGLPLSQERRGHVQEVMDAIQGEIKVRRRVKQGGR